MIKTTNLKIYLIKYYFKALENIPMFCRFRVQGREKLTIQKHLKDFYEEINY